MLHLIADFTIIVTEGGREDSKDGRDEGGGVWTGGGGDDHGQTQVKKSVCEKCTTHSRGTPK